MSYSKLHSSLVNSSLWTENDEVRILFITLLAMCDRHGEVQGSRIGIERIANILPDPDGTNPWEVLMSPDKDSSDLMRNPENEGRRIEEIPGGFKLLNFEYYRGLRNEDDRREQNRVAQAKLRSRKSDKSAPVSQALANISQRKPSPSASASVSDSESGSEEKKEGIKEKMNGLVDSEWIARLVNDPTYKGIDVNREFGKMANWCRENRVEPTRRRFINWLNRADRKLDGTNQKHTAESGRGLGTTNEGKSTQYKDVGKVR